MSYKDRRDHHLLLKETGRFRLTKEQEDTINTLMGGVKLEFEENNPTFDLPILARRK
jgi:hypothetical protein